MSGWIDWLDVGEMRKSACPWQCGAVDEGGLEFCLLHQVLTVLLLLWGLNVASLMYDTPDKLGACNPSSTFYHFSDIPVNHWKPLDAGVMRGPAARGVLHLSAPRKESENGLS